MDLTNDDSCGEVKALLIGFLKGDLDRVLEKLKND